MALPVLRKACRKPTFWVLSSKSLPVQLTALRIATTFAGICGQCPLSLDMRFSLWLSQDH